MPRIVAGSLFVLSLFLFCGSVRTGLAQDSVAEQEDDDAAPATAGPADAGKPAGSTTEGTEDEPAAKPAESKPETKDERPGPSRNAPAPGDPRRSRPGSFRDPRGGRGSGEDPNREVSDFTGTEKPPAGAERESRTEPRPTFNFRFAPWKTVLERFAEVANLNLDMDEPPPGTFNYYDKGTYSVKEALDIINGYLIQKGYILVRRDRFLVVANFGRGPVPPNLIPTISLAELPKRGRNEYVSVVIPLANIDAKTAAEEINHVDRRSCCRRLGCCKCRCLLVWLCKSLIA